METSKIKIRIGSNEFEAEGPAETVQAQFAAFKQLIESTPTQPTTQPVENVPQIKHFQGSTEEFVRNQLSKIMHVSGRVVSLTAIPAKVEDAALLIMLGHKELRNHFSVTGQELGDGLAQSGKPVNRVDRVMDKAIQEASVLKTGLKRATRYRLTNQGMARAQRIADEILESLP